MKIPFGFEVPELVVVRPFLERSTTGARSSFPVSSISALAFLAQAIGFLDLSGNRDERYTPDRRSRLTVAFPRSEERDHRPPERAQAQIVPAVAVHRSASPPIRVAAFTKVARRARISSSGATSKAATASLQATEVQIIRWFLRDCRLEQFSPLRVRRERSARRFYLAPHARTSDVRAELVRASSLDRGLETGRPSRRRSRSARIRLVSRG